MIERKYVEYELAKGKKDICIVCNCKNAETLNTFLCSDVRPVSYTHLTLPTKA